MIDRDGLGFSTGDAAALLGMEPSRLQEWVRLGYARPAAYRPGCPGSSMGWNRLDLVQAKLFGHLTCVLGRPGAQRVIEQVFVHRRSGVIRILCPTDWARGRFPSSFVVDCFPGTPQQRSFAGTMQILIRLKPFHDFVDEALKGWGY